MGSYMARVFDRRSTWLDRLLLPIERLIYRMTGVRADEEMRWTEYGAAMLLFSFATLLLTYVVERMQNILPWNPQHLPRSAVCAGVEYGGLVYDQHELAVLCAGADDELSHPDARPGHA